MVTGMVRFVTTNFSVLCLIFIFTGHLRNTFNSLILTINFTVVKSSPICRVYVPLQTGPLGCVVQTVMESNISSTRDRLLHDPELCSPSTSVAKSFLYAWVIGIPS